MKLISFDGFSFSDPTDDYYGQVLWEKLANQWQVTPTFVARRNDHPVYTGMVISERSLPVHFVFRGSGNGFWMDYHTLLGSLDVTNQTPRWLVAELPTGQLVQRLAIVSPVGPTANGLNTADVVFYSDDPTWYAQEDSTVAAVTVTNSTYGGVDLINDGLSGQHAHLRITPSGSSALTVRRFSIHNNTAKTLRMFPFRVDFGGNTYTASPPSPGYKALLRDGVLQRCELVNWFGRQAYLWMVIDELAPGEQADYELLESASYIMPGTGFNSYTRPAFAIDWVKGTQNGAGTTTTIKLTGAAWATNQWVGAEVDMLTGANAGIVSPPVVVSNTADTLTISPAMTVGNASGDEVLVTMSRNGKWVYNVKTTERSDANRGLWWINRGQSLPSQVRFDVPGGWQRYLYATNDDEKTQARWTAIDTGAGPDYFSILNAQRIWKDGARYSERNTGDGVMLSLPAEITSLKLDYQLANPNRTSAMIVGGRESGSELFGEKYRDDAMYAALTASAVQTVTIGGGATQVYVGLVNRFGDAMGADWPKDSGTATAATGTTLTDATKGNWSVNHWNGATLRITGGTGIGQARTVTSQSGTTLTVSAWTTTPDATSQYTLTLPPNSSQLLSNTTWELNWDASGISSLPPGTAQTAYLMERTLYVGRPLSTDDPPYQRIRTDQASTGIYTVLRSDEMLEIDGETMRIWISTPAFGTPIEGEIASETVEVRPAPGAAIVEDVAVDGSIRLAEEWMRCRPGTTAFRVAALTGAPSYELLTWLRAGWDG